MEFLNSWVLWFLLATLVVTGYVQDIGTQFERVSGLKRSANLETYHFLFRADFLGFSSDSVVLSV